MNRLICERTHIKQFHRITPEWKRTRSLNELYAHRSYITSEHKFGLQLYKVSLKDSYD